MNEINDATMWACIGALKPKLRVCILMSDRFVYEYTLQEIPRLIVITGYGKTIYEAARDFYKHVCEKEVDDITIGKR